MGSIQRKNKINFLTGFFIGAVVAGFAVHFFTTLTYNQRLGRLDSLERESEKLKDENQQCYDSKRHLSQDLAFLQQKADTLMSEM